MQPQRTVTVTRKPWALARQICRAHIARGLWESGGPDLYTLQCMQPLGDPICIPNAHGPQGTSFETFALHVGLGAEGEVKY